MKKILVLIVALSVTVLSYAQKSQPKDQLLAIIEDAKAEFEKNKGKLLADTSTAARYYESKEMLGADFAEIYHYTYDNTSKIMFDFFYKGRNEPSKKGEKFINAAKELIKEWSGSDNYKYTGYGDSNVLFGEYFVEILNDADGNYIIETVESKHKFTLIFYSKNWGTK